MAHLDKTATDWTTKKLNRFQKLMTKAELAKLPALYATDGVPLAEKKAVLHYFGGSFDFWAFEFNPETGEFFGAFKTQGGVEMGYLSAEELCRAAYGMSVAGRVLRAPIERDLHFTGKIPSVEN